LYEILFFYSFFIYFFFHSFSFIFEWFGCYIIRLKIFVCSSFNHHKPILSHFNRPTYVQKKPFHILQNIFSLLSYKISLVNQQNHPVTMYDHHSIFFIFVISVNQFFFCFFFFYYILFVFLLYFRFVCIVFCVIVVDVVFIECHSYEIIITRPHPLNHIYISPTKNY